MKKSFILTMLLCLTLCGTSFAQQDERGYISVNTNTIKEFAPDTAEISISVVSSDKASLQKAIEQNKILSDKIHQMLKTMINTQNGDYIKTSDFNAQPVYKYVNNKKVLDKYEVSNTILLHTKSVNNVGTFIDKAIALGATDISRLNFMLANYDKSCDDMLFQATKKGYERANILAKTTGTYVTGVKHISTSCSTSSSNYSPRMMYAKGVSNDSMSEMTTSIEAGIIKINAMVNADYFVK